MRKMSLNKKKINYMHQGIWLVLIITLWEGIVRFGMINPLILPSFSSVIISLFKSIIKGEVILQLINSIKLILLGLLLGTLFAIIMNYLSYFYQMPRSLFSLLCGIFHPLPGIALLPVVIIWLGVGEKAVFFIILHAVIWPLFINIQLGFQGIERSLIEVAHNYGAKNWQVFRYVLLPESKDALISGLSIGWSRGFRGLISAEMVFGAIGSIGGIGWFLYEKRVFMDTEGMFAGIILVATIGIIIENLISHININNY